MFGIPANGSLNTFLEQLMVLEPTGVYEPVTFPFECHDKETKYAKSAFTSFNCDMYLNTFSYNVTGKPRAIRKQSIMLV